MLLSFLVTSSVFFSLVDEVVTVVSESECVPFTLLQELAEAVIRVLFVSL